MLVSLKHNQFNLSKLFLFIGFLFLTTYSTAWDLTLADPTIFYENGKYYVSGTSSDDGFFMYESQDLKYWRPSGPNPSGMILQKGSGIYGTQWFWAPQFVKHNNTYYMLYTANEQVCIATSNKINGAYGNGVAIDLSAKNIDPFLFKDDNGKFYLYHVRFTSGNRIWVGEFDINTKKIVSGTLQLCFNRTQAWEKTSASPSAEVIEGPTVIKRNGIYYMFYSANHFESPDYAVGYATASSPLGPWTKYSGNPIIHRNLVGDKGAGHGDVFFDGVGNPYYVYHSHWTQTAVHPRRTWIMPLQFNANNTVSINSSIKIQAKVEEPPLSFKQIWNYSETSGTKKDWATDFTAIRNMDYAAGKLYVVSNGNKITVVNAQTGNRLGDLSNLGISGGALALIDCKVVGSKIIASNVTTNPEDPLKVYIWDNDDAHPIVLLSTTNFGSGIERIGDCIGVRGDTNNGTLYFASKHTDGKHRVISYKITNGVCSTTPVVTIMTGHDGQGIDFGHSARVQPTVNDKYWITGQNCYPSLFKPDNKLEITLRPAAVNNVIHGNAFQAFAFQGNSYGVATTFNAGTPTITAGRASLFDAEYGWANALKMADIPAAGLGTTRNDTYASSIAAAVNGSVGVEVWVLIHKQGIAYYRHGTAPNHNPQAPNPPSNDPTLTTSLSSLSFSAEANSSQAKTVTVTGTNVTGNISLSLSGANASLFSISSASLNASGGSVTVTYKPTSAGSHSATLTASAAGAASKTVALSGSASAQVVYNYNISFNEVWNYSQISGKTANWITNGSQVTQDMAFHDGKLYVVHRNASNTDNKIYIVNAYTGAKVGELNTAACNTGTYFISSIGVIGGKVVACNLATGAAEPIVVYKWENDNAAATTWLSTTSRDNVARAGDKMSVSGDLTNGKIWFNFESKLYYYKVTNSAIATTPTVVNLTKGGVAFNPGANSAAASIQENADGSLWVSGKDLITARFNASGVWQEDLGSDLLNDAQGSDASFFSFGEKQYAAVVDYLNKSNTTISEGAATLIDVTGGISSASKKGSYPVNGLGTSRNTAFRTTVLTQVANDKAYMWVLAPFQGAAHYEYNAVIVGSEDVAVKHTTQIVVNRGVLELRGMDAANIDIYTITGQRIKSAKGVNKLSIDNLKGVFIAVIKSTNDNIFKEKIIIN